LQSKLIIVISLSFALGLPCAADSTSSKGKKQAKPVAVQPAPPPVVLTPEQMPAQQPQVIYSGEQLTITAPNSTLGDVLRGVRRMTGATLEIPGNATERVVGKFGPGSPRDVLASLLNGTHFNYVLLGSATNPNALDRVILTSKSGGEGQPAPTQMAAQQNQPGSSEAGEEPAEKVFDDGPDAQQNNGDIFGNADDQTQSADDQNQQNGQPANNVRTPEQLLQDLQQRQQQMQQQMQQGIQPNGPQGFPRPPQPQPQ
jgi:hypothetical protein